MLRVHSPDDSTFMREMTSWPPCHLEYVTSSIDTCLLEEQAYQISSRSDLKRATKHGEPNLLNLSENKYKLMGPILSNFLSK